MKDGGVKELRRRKRSRRCSCFITTSASLSPCSAVIIENKGGYSELELELELERPLLPSITLPS